MKLFSSPSFRAFASSRSPLTAGSAQPSGPRIHADEADSGPFPGLRAGERRRGWQPSHLWQVAGYFAALALAGACIGYSACALSSCSAVSAYEKRNGIVVSGGVSYDGASATVSRRADGKTVVGLEVNGNELQHDLAK